MDAPHRRHHPHPHPHHRHHQQSPHAQDQDHAEQQQTALYVADHVVFFNELTPETKVKYTKFLIDNQIQFTKCSNDGKYVANVRLEQPRPESFHPPLELLPQELLPQDPTTNIGGPDQSLPPNETQEQEQSPLNCENAIPVEYQRYLNLYQLLEEKPLYLASAGAMKTTKLVRLINDVYDLRYEEHLNPSAAGAIQFSRYLHQHLINRFGLRRLVQQQVWEIIKALDKWRKRLDVAVFSSFLEARYDETDLLFFLVARATVSRHTVKNNTGTTSYCDPPSRWIAQAQCTPLAQQIFRANSDPIYAQFMHKLRVYGSTQCIGRPCGQWLEANEFLFLMVESHHDVHQEPPQDRNNDADADADADADFGRQQKPTIEAARQNKPSEQENQLEETSSDVETRVATLIQRFRSRQ